MAFAFFLIGGCASKIPTFQAQAGAVFGAEYSELNFEPGKFGSGNIFKNYKQHYSIREGDGPFLFVSYFGRSQKTGKTILVPVGKKIMVSAVIVMNYGAPGITNSGRNACVNVSSFTPVANVRYRISQDGEAEGPCKLTIIDASTGREPDDLERAQFQRTEADDQ